jgi:hypothetical protein
MPRYLRLVFAAGLFLAITALPAAAGEAGTPFPDADGDGVPDLPPGEPGDWDDQIGATTFAGYLAGTDAAGTQFAGDAGSSLEGPCAGFATSFDGDGNVVDFAFDPGGGGAPIDGNGEQTFTKANPFIVDTEGSVFYYGTTAPAVFNDHNWKITVQGVGLDSGGDDNPDDEVHSAGVVELGDTLPFPFTALLKVKGNIDDPDGDSCLGEGWIKFEGPNPILTPPGILAILLFGAGFAGLLFNSRPAQTW